MDRRFREVQQDHRRSTGTVTAAFAVGRPVRETQDPSRPQGRGNPLFEFVDEGTTKVVEGNLAKQETPVLRKKLDRCNTGVGGTGGLANHAGEDGYLACGSGSLRRSRHPLVKGRADRTGEEVANIGLRSTSVENEQEQACKRFAREVMHCTGTRKGSCHRFGVSVMPGVDRFEPVQVPLTKPTQADFVSVGTPLKAAVTLS